MYQHFMYGQHKHTTTHKTLTLAAHKTCKWQSEFKDNTHHLNVNTANQK
jgi:hypothetical protein